MTQVSTHGFATRSSLGGLGTLALIVLLALGGCGENDDAVPDMRALSTSEPEDGGDGHDAGSGDAATPPAAIEMIQLAVGDLVFDARAAGPEDGQLVLLLHGFPETSYQWRAQLPALAQAGFRAIAPDQRGYSPGARPIDIESYAIANLVNDALGMADALNAERFHIVGHDWGGAVAWAVAAIVPARVITLTALSTPHPDAFAAALADETSCQYQASSYFEKLSGPSPTAADLLAIPDSGFMSLSLDAQQEYIQNVIFKPEAFAAAVAWYQANANGRMLDQPNLGAIQVPTLYLWGTEDPTFCRETAEATAALVAADYTFIPVQGAGHWLSELNADEVTTALLAHVKGQP